MAQNRPKSMDYSPWFWSILGQFSKSHFHLDFDWEDTETKFDGDRKVSAAIKDEINDIFGRVKIGPKSTKKHGL